MKIFINISKVKLKFIMNAEEVFPYFKLFIEKGLDFSKERFRSKEFLNGLESLFNYRGETVADYKHI